ncbi:MAG: hypothetical protein ACHREM_01235 [Polyangiales bacterium]
MEVRPAPPQLRLAPGDVIRCQAFAIGLRLNADADGPILVAWQKAAYPEHHVRTGHAQHANEPSRGTAPFLVHTVKLNEAEGPDDVAPGERRLSREIVCVRLGLDFSFTRHAEQIRFALNEPMSVASPDESSVELVGYAVLPIVWDEAK